MIEDGQIEGDTWAKINEVCFGVGRNGRRLEIGWKTAQWSNLFPPVVALRGTIQLNLQVKVFFHFIFF